MHSIFYKMLSWWYEPPPPRPPPSYLANSAFNFTSCKRWMKKLTLCGVGQLCLPPPSKLPLRVLAVMVTITKIQIHVVIFRHSPCWWIGSIYLCLFILTPCCDRLWWTCLWGILTTVPPSPWGTRLLVSVSLAGVEAFAAFILSKLLHSLRFLNASLNNSFMDSFSWTSKKSSRAPFAICSYSPIPWSSAFYL